MMSDEVFQTKRLRIRCAQPVDRDVDFLWTLWTNPQVMAQVGFPQGLRITKEEVRLQLTQPQESIWGAKLLAELKSTGEIVGECYLGAPDGEGIAETDVKLAPAFWGQHYGVEIKRGLLDYLFEHTDCRAVQATPNVGNIPSIKMQEAVGGRREGECFFDVPVESLGYRMPVYAYIYRVYREDWDSK